MDINNLITRLRDIAWDFPPEHSINRAADMLTVLQAENNKLQDELKCQEAEIARLNEAREIANEKAREYEKRGINELQEKLKKEAEARKKQADIITEERSQKYEQIKIVDSLKKELEQVKKERDAAVKEIFKWVGCPACKCWNSEDEWCKKHDRSADSVDGCLTPEWRGLEE